MIKTIVGNIRKGKTSFLVCSALKNALNAEKITKFKKTCKKLKNNGFLVNEKNIFGLYSCDTLNINYNDNNFINFSSVKIDVKRLFLGSGLFILPHSTIAIEEGQRFFPCREFSKFSTMQALFFQTSGHYGIDIFIDTQDITNLDKNIRNITEIVEIKSFEIFNKLNQKINIANQNNFNFIVYTVIEYDNVNDYLNKKNGSTKKYKFFINPFQCYNSFNQDKLFLPDEKEKNTICIY